MNRNTARVYGVTRNLVLGCLVICSTAARGEDEERVTRVGTLLQQVAAFEMGDPSGPLEELERIVFQLPRDSADRESVERMLVETLKSDATVEAKRVICRQLHAIGTVQCIPVLERMLADPELAHMARYALGRLEDPAACEALARALGNTSGRLLAGIIDTLGERRWEAARRDLVKLLGDADRQVATSAAIALGRLGGTASAEALLAAYPRAAASLQPEFSNALLQVADQLALAGELDEAAAIFAWFDTPNATEHQRFAALRGAVITRRREAADRLMAAMTSDDSPAARYAISLVPMVPGGSATEAFVAVLGDLPIEHQVLLLRALGDQGDASASPALVAAVAREEPEIRQAALAALGNLGDASAVSTLLRASAEAEGDEQKVARAAMRQLIHPEVETQLVGAMEQVDPGPRVEAIRALAARRASVAPDKLLTAARDPEPTVRQAAWEALGTLAGEPQLAALVDLAVAAGEGDDQAAASEAIDRVLFRCADRQRGTEVILANLSTAPREDHPVLLRLLATVGTPAGLARLRTALRDPDAAIRDAAVRALASWPDADAGDDLLALIDQTRNETWRELALQGYLRLAAAADDPAAMYLAALQRVRRVDDRKAVLDGLGRSSNALEALNLTLQYLEEESLQTTAGIAAIRIAFRLRQQHEQAARDALARVLATVPHPDVQQRARDVIVEMDKHEDHILQWVTVGPFQEDGQEGAALYASVFEPEKDPDGVDWQPLTEGIGSWEINLEATYGPLDFCAAYLRTRVWSPKDQAAQLELGSDDGVKAWLNGELLLDQWREGGAEPRQQLVPVELKQGWNDLMLKVVDQRGGWVAAARVRRPDGSALEGLKIEGR